MHISTATVIDKANIYYGNKQKIAYELSIDIHTFDIGSI